MRKELKKANIKMVSLKMEEDLIVALKQEAEQRGVPYIAVVRQALRKELKIT